MSHRRPPVAGSAWADVIMLGVLGAVGCLVLLWIGVATGVVG